MDSMSPPVRPDVVTFETLPRPTARPIRVQFADVLAGGARALVQGAQAAVRALPGAPLMAAAVRGGGLGAGPSSGSGVAVGSSPEGPGGVGPVGSLMQGTPSGANLAASGDGIEGTLAQSQQMNLYYLQVQQAVNDQNRNFTALSNVLEVEHNTAKSAIGNIH